MTKRAKAKIVQIVTAACAESTGDGEFDGREYLYALDSDGQIWIWSHETPTRTSGWFEMDLPHEHLSVAKPK